VNVVEGALSGAAAGAVTGAVVAGGEVAGLEPDGSGKK
jgi:hypothetical protein